MCTYIAFLIGLKMLNWVPTIVIIINLSDMTGQPKENAFNLYFSILFSAAKSINMYLLNFKICFVWGTFLD